MIYCSGSCPSFKHAKSRRETILNNRKLGIDIYGKGIERQVYREREKINRMIL
jgi:hypothetical protein